MNITFFWIHYLIEDMLLEQMNVECLEDLKDKTVEQIDQFIEENELDCTDIYGIGDAVALMDEFNMERLDDNNGYIFYVND